jgi:hypothetical protein
MLLVSSLSPRLLLKTHWRRRSEGFEEETGLKKYAIEIV